MPAATWRRWYPHDIEKWNSSPAIQMLSDAAYRAYHSLIMAQWESDEGYLPENERLLQTLARVRDESQWKAIRDEIFHLFSSENGRVFSSKQRAEWNRAKAVSDKKGRRCPQCGKSLSTGRHVCGHNNNNNNSIKKPSLAKREVDPRHGQFKEVCQRYYDYHQIAMSWDGSEGKQLSALLAANPTLTAEQFRKLLHNRTNSRGVNHSKRPSSWLRHATDFSSGPLNEFGQPLGTAPQGKVQPLQAPLNALDAIQERNRKAMEEVERERHAS